MTFRPLSVPVQNKQVQHRRDRALQKPWWRSASGSIFSPPSKLFAGTSALHRLTCTPRTLGRALQRLPSYATESGGGMLIILRGFFFVCLLVWFVLLCVALLGWNQCRLTLWVLHVAMRCRAPFNPPMHDVFVEFKMFACFLFGFFLRVFCFFSPNTWFIIAWLLAQRGASSEKWRKFAQPRLNCISTGSCFSYSCLSAVSSQSVRSDLWPGDINKSLFFSSFFLLHNRVHLDF